MVHHNPYIIPFLTWVVVHPLEIPQSTMVKPPPRNLPLSAFLGAPDFMDFWINFSKPWQFRVNGVEAKKPREKEGMKGDYTTNYQLFMWV